LILGSEPAWYSYKDLQRLLAIPEQDVLAV